MCDLSLLNLVYVALLDLPLLRDTSDMTMAAQRIWSVTLMACGLTRGVRSLLVVAHGGAYRRLSVNVEASTAQPSPVSLEDNIEGMTEMDELGAGICLVPGQVVVRVDAVPGNARRIYTGMDVRADGDIVYDLLTDYEALAAVVPNLVVNEIIERRPKGARLRQVGAAQVLPGLNFRASMIMDVRELPLGLSDDEIAENVEASRPLKRGTYPRPWAAAKTLPIRDIAMQSAAGEPGDFTLYQGLWRMQPVPDCAAEGQNATRLTFTVEIQPRPWLPVSLVESRITQDLIKNVEAVAAEAERRNACKSTKLAPSAEASIQTAKKALLSAVQRLDKAGLGAPTLAVQDVEDAATRLRYANTLGNRAYGIDTLKGRWRVLFSSALARADSLAPLAPGSNRRRILATLRALTFRSLELHFRTNSAGGLSIDTLVNFAPDLNKLLPPPVLRLEYTLIAPRPPFAVTTVRETVQLEPARGPRALPRFTIPDAWFERFMTSASPNPVLSFDIIHADDDFLVTLDDSGDLKVCAKSTSTQAPSPRV